MRQFRFVFTTLLTILFVINAAFWRKTIAVVLCGVMGFNPVSSYYLLQDYGKAEAAISSSKVASSQYSDEYQNDFDNFPHEPPITDLTGNWIGAGAGFMIDQRGCTAGGTVTSIDGQEPSKHKFTLTQNNDNQLISRPYETINYGSGSYVTNFQGKISGDNIIFLANSPSVSIIDKITGTVNHTGDTITGKVYCKTAAGPATAQGTFTWTRVVKITVDKADSTYPITTEPAMPQIVATAHLSDDTLNPDSYSWSFEIGGYEANYTSPQEEPTAAEEQKNGIEPISIQGPKKAYWYPYSISTEKVTQSNTWTINKNGPIYGGWGKLTVTVKVGEKVEKSAPYWIDIPGKNPDVDTVKNYLHNNVVKNFVIKDSVVMNADHNFDIFAHILCHESNFQQFNPKPNKKEPKDIRVTDTDFVTPKALRPKYGKPAGIGIAQLDPASFPDQQWSWKLNIDGGYKLYESKLKGAYKWRTTEQSRLEEEREAVISFIKEQGFKFKEVPVITIPQLTNDQLQRETIRQYNGGHQYHYDAQYIAKVIDKDQKTASIEIQGSKVWTELTGTTTDNNGNKITGTVGGLWQKPNVITDWKQTRSKWLSTNPITPRYIEIVKGCQVEPS